jgi:hypothetical protein
MLLNTNRTFLYTSCRTEFMYTFVDGHFNFFQTHYSGPSGLFGHPGPGGTVVRLWRRWRWWRQRWRLRRRCSRAGRGGGSGRCKLACGGGGRASRCGCRCRCQFFGAGSRSTTVHSTSLHRRDVRRHAGRVARRAPWFAFRARRARRARLPGSFHGRDHHGGGTAVSGLARLADPGPALPGDGVWRHVGL